MSAVPTKSACRPKRVVIMNNVGNTYTEINNNNVGANSAYTRGAANTVYTNMP